MTDLSIRLEPLLCPNCKHAIPAKVDEVAWLCQNCNQGILLGQDNEVALSQIHFQQRSAEISVGFPYWVTTAKVVLNRETLRGNQSAVMQKFWQNPRTVFIPAYPLEMQALINRAAALIKEPPLLFESEPIVFRSVVLPPHDLRAYIEFLVMQIEAERQDNLKQLTFDLQLSEPVLWVLSD